MSTELEKGSVEQETQGIEAWIEPVDSILDGVSRPQAAVPARFEAMLRRLIAANGSDLHLSAGQPPRMRVEGDLRIMPDVPPLTGEEELQLMAALLDERHRAQLAKRMYTDLAWSLEPSVRCRIHLFYDARGLGAVIHLLPSSIRTLEQLSMPPVLRRWCDNAGGLVMITGGTGQGKTTTAASLIDHINRTRDAHIVTLEDPIEYLHESRRGMVNQREVGGHVLGFRDALRSVLREDPDVVLVGEMRDLPSIRMTLEAASLGHLVFATFHARTTLSAIARLIEMFPTERQNEVRSVLADVLVGVVTQTLCRKVNGGRVPAVEVLVSTPAIANLIRESKLHQLPTLMSAAKGVGDMLMNDDLVRLVREHVVAYEEAISRSPDRADLIHRFEHTPGHGV